MKKIVFIYFLFLSCLSFAQSPSLLDSNVIWREYIDEGLICGLGNCHQTYWQCNDFIDGDTSISGIAYKKIYRTGTLYSFHGYIGGSTTTPSFRCREYTAAIRADSILQRMYVIRATDSTEYLLYDFDLAVGDTLPETFNCSPNTCAVKSIDSVSINGTYHKRLNIGLLAATDPVINSIVEGIGANTGLLNYFGYYFAAPAMYSKLHGFYIDSVLVYNPYAITSPLISCPGPAGNDENDDQLHLQLYPNPANSIITIETEAHESAQLEIYNSIGKRIISDLINNGKTTIDLSIQANGIYFAKIYQQDKTAVIKIIKE